MSSIVAKSCNVVWLEPTLDDMRFLFEPEKSVEAFERHKTSREYVDCHGWQFTPSSFVLMIKSLRRLAFIKSGTAHFSTNRPPMLNRHEFYTTLSRSAPVCEIPDMELLKSSERELREIAISRDDIRADDSREIEQLRAENAALRRSTSWRITAPMRWVKARLVGTTT